MHSARFSFFYYSIFRLRIETDLLSNNGQEVAKHKFSGRCVIVDFKSGVPGGIRTPNLLIRSQKLYPVELQAREEFSIFEFRSSIEAGTRRRAHRSKIETRNSKIELGWPTGLEPATARTTIWGSTIELWPPTRLHFRFAGWFCKGKARSGG